MAKVIVTSMQDLNFKTDDGSVIDGVKLTLLLEDGSVEKPFLKREDFAKIGFTKEMLCNPIADDELNIIEANFIPQNGKLKLASLK